jgi:prepilin-type N-terminal cleavage/methylation domain-containing protein
MQRVVSSRATPRKNLLSSFTLVELLVVMAIIAILTAITLAAASAVLNTASRSRARSEIQAMSTALESYKNDNGAYPQTNTMTTNTYASDDGNNTKGTSAYMYSSEAIYQALTSMTNATDTPYAGMKVYMSFKAGQLSSTTPTYVQDPWGYSYGYSTGSGGGGSTTNYPYNGSGFFDLWSTGGSLYGASTFTNTWVNNWSQ